MDKQKAVPEVILKRRERAKKDLAAKLLLIKKRNQEDRNRTKKAFQRAKKYAIQYKNEYLNDLERKKRAAEKDWFYVPPAEKLMLVIRIRGLKKIPPKPKKVLKLFRLKKVNNAVFIRVNKSTISMLKIAEPYVTWGYPTLETIKNLIYRRGFVTIQGQRIALTNNRYIEEKFGEKNIICAEDMINQIYNVGEHFRDVTNFLWPFHLRPPRGGYRSIKKHYVTGGSYGNREDLINKLVEGML